MGLSDDGFDSPLRTASPAEPECMTGPYRHCVVGTLEFGMQGKQSSALWMLTMCATRHLWNGLTGPSPLCVNVGAFKMLLGS